MQAEIVIKNPVKIVKKDRNFYYRLCPGHEVVLQKKDEKTGTVRAVEEISSVTGSMFTSDTYQQEVMVYSENQSTEALDDTYNG